MAYHAIYTNLTLRHTARGLWFRPMITQMPQKNGRPTKNVRFCFLSRDFN